MILLGSCMRPTQHKKFFNKVSLDLILPSLILQVCQSAESNCIAKDVDLVFMVTSSSSVGFTGWQNIITFVTSIINALDIDAGRARVGFILLVFCLFAAENNYSSISSINSRSNNSSSNSTSIIILL